MDAQLDESSNSAAPNEETGLYEMNLYKMSSKAPLLHPDGDASANDKTAPQRQECTQLESPPDNALEVVIVTYKHYDMVENCLRSVEEAKPSGWCIRVHVVDNASNDGTAEHIARNFPSVNLYTQLSNDGFSKGNNIALRVAQAPYILLLNPDTVLYAGTLEHLLARMSGNQRIGVIGPRLVQADGTFDHASKRNLPTPSSAMAYLLQRALTAQSAYTAPEIEEHQIGRVGSVNGAFMLLRKDAMDEVGVLDERFWMYGEDLDWCKRFSDAGWEVWYDGTVTALHLKGGTSGKRRSLYLNWQFHRSMALYYDKHHAREHRALNSVVYSAIALKFVSSALGNGLATLYSVWRRKREM